MITNSWFRNCTKLHSVLLKSTVVLKSLIWVTRRSWHQSRAFRPSFKLLFAFISESEKGKKEEKYQKLIDLYLFFKKILNFQGIENTIFFSFCNTLIGNKAPCRPIRSVIILVINKSHSRCTVDQFCYHSYDYRPNLNPLSSITITNLFLGTVFFLKLKKKPHKTYDIYRHVIE